MLRNQVQLIGRLGNDPEIKHLENGQTVANINLATNGYYVNSKGEKVEDTQWHKVVAWGNTAKIAEQYLQKGKEVAIQGKLTYRSYEDKDGNTKYLTEVIANELLLLEKSAKN
jgi:single-strand DNA-binding protein